MIRRRFVAVALGSGLLAILGPRATAHKLQYSVSDLRWRPDAGRLEVAHSIHLDDAMALLASLGDYDGAVGVRTQAQLLLYVEQHFKLSRDATRLVLEPVGADVEGDYLWVYQELDLPVFPSSLRVQCTLLHDYYPLQQNQVNFTVGDTVRTLRFDKDHTTGRLL